MKSVAKYNLKDARDLVVLATGNAYLQAIAGAARVETAQAQVETAKALYDKAVAQQQAGVLRQSTRSGHRSNTSHASSN